MGQHDDEGLPTTDDNDSKLPDEETQFPDESSTHLDSDLREKDSALEYPIEDEEE